MLQFRKLINSKNTLYILKFIYLNIIFYFSLSTDALAYIDPGTGGFIIQALIGAIAAVSIFFQKIKQSIIKILKKIFSNKNDNFK